MGKKQPGVYQVWAQMRARCLNLNHKSYKNYGARGITVCDRWRSFKNFYDDMGERPAADYSIERINNDGNYEPGNCKWATSREQTRNTRRSLWIIYRGEKRLFIDVLEERQLEAYYGGIARRIFTRGWDVERALSEPLNNPEAKRTVAAENLAFL